MTNLPVSTRVAATLRELAERMGAGMVEVGWMENATYEGRGTKYVASAMWWLEFGHGGTFPAPPRPFFRPMITEESKHWGADMARLAKATNYDGRAVLGEMGDLIRGELTKALIDLSAPPLSPTTLRLRKVFGNKPELITLKDVLQAQRDVAAGSDLASGTEAHPGIWTDHALNSVTFRVMR